MMRLKMRPIITAFGRQIGRRHVSSTTTLQFASKENDVLFQGEMAALYQAIFDQHSKPTGPWETMDAKLSKYVNKSGSTILDLATGPGEPGVTMAKRHSDMHFILSDISKDMMKKAQARAEGLDNVKCVLSDMQDLQEFENDSMDSVVCCYGLMFPSDVNKAVAEIVRVLRPGGTLITTYWKVLPALDFPTSVMQAVLGTPSPPPLPINPLALKEPGVVNKLLTSAQLNIVEEEEYEYSFDLSDDPDFAYKIAVFPILPFLEEQSGSAHEVARQMFDEFAREQDYIQPNGEYVVPGNIYELVVATKE